MKNVFRMHCTTVIRLSMLTLVFVSLQNERSAFSADDREVRPSWESGPTGTRASLRGLDALDDRIVWASGAEGTVIRSTDGGSSWTNCSPPGYSLVEFRCVVALDETTAVVASAGTPAVLLRTDDAGASWRKVYDNDSPRAFFDAMKFWDSKRGIAMSDPVGDRILVVITADGGNTWQETRQDSLPTCRDGEAAFAASNGSIALGPSGQTWIGMGGTEAPESRVYFRSNWDAPLVARSCPLKSSPTEGVFALATSGSDENLLVVAVGGDYRDNTRKKNASSMAKPTTAIWSKDGGKNWESAAVMPAHFRSSVIFVPRLINGADGFITTGPTGSEYSNDGDTWNPIDGLGFHALSVGENTVFACGSDGRFAVLKWR